MRAADVLARCTDTVTLPGGREMAITPEGFSGEVSRPSSARRNFLASFLWSHADGRCSVCGEPTRLDAAAGEPDRAVIMHLVPTGTDRLGWREGNLMSGCEACNHADSGRNLLPYVHLFKGAHVPTAWPKGERFNATQGNSAEEFRRRADIRASLGLPY